MLEIVVGLCYLSGLIFPLTTAKCHYNQNSQELGVFMECIILYLLCKLPIWSLTQYTCGQWRCNFARSPEFNLLPLFVWVYRNLFFLLKPSTKTHLCTLGSGYPDLFSSMNTIVTLSSYIVWSSWWCRHQQNLMRCFSLLDLVLWLICVSYIQVGSQALSKSRQKVAHTVSAAATSVSASAAAQRGTATVPFPAACTLACIGRFWGVFGLFGEGAWAGGGAVELLMEKLWDSATCCRPSKTFFRQGSVEQHSGISGSLLFHSVKRGSSRSVVFRVHCWSRELRRICLF